MGIIIIILKVVNKEYLPAIHYLITTIALCMGYIVIGS